MAGKDRDEVLDDLVHLREHPPHSIDGQRGDVQQIDEDVGVPQVVRAEAIDGRTCGLGFA